MVSYKYEVKIMNLTVIDTQSNFQIEFYYITQNEYKFKIDGTLYNSYFIHIGLYDTILCTNKHQIRLYIHIKINGDYTSFCIRTTISKNKREWINKLYAIVYKKINTCNYANNECLKIWECFYYKYFLKLYTYIIGL